MKENLSDCDFIKEQYIFHSYTDFLKIGRRIKKMYEKLNNIQKEFYHYYIYANQIMTPVQKSRIWEWLNGDIDEKALLTLVKPKNKKDK